MNRFVKKNMILIIVISLSSVAAIALLVWTAIEHSRMSAYINQVNKLREDIGVLVSKKPAPVDENKPRIRQDIETYSKAADAFVRAFNDPLLPALEDFIKVVRYWDAEKKANRPISLAEFKTLFFEDKIGFPGILIIVTFYDSRNCVEVSFCKLWCNDFRDFFRGVSLDIFHAFL